MSKVTPSRTEIRSRINCSKVYEMIISRVIKLRSSRWVSKSSNKNPASSVGVAHASL